MTLQAHGGYLDIDLRGSGSHLGNETIRLKIKKKKKKNTSHGLARKGAGKETT